MTPRKIIWTSEISLSDWEKYAKMYPAVTTNEQKYDIMRVENERNLSKVQFELRKLVDGYILAFVFTEVKNKTLIHIGLLTNNLETVINSVNTGVKDGNYTWYVDSHKNLWCEATERDGKVHKVLYRYIPNSCMFDIKFHNMDKLNCCGKLTKEYILKATKSVGTFVSQIYGWK